MKDIGRILVTLLILAGSLSASDLAKASTPHVFYVAPYGNLWELTYNASNGSWTQTNIFTGQNVSPQNSTIASFAGGGKIYVCYFNQTNGQPPESVYLMSSPDNLTWTTSAVSTMNADINSGLTGFTDSNGNPRIFYVGTPVGGQEYLLETFWTGSSWETVQLYGGVEPGTALTGYLFNGSPEVFYISVDGHIQEAYLQGSTWHITDVTTMSGAPLPMSGSSLMGYQFNSNGPVHFIANDLHVHQSWWNGSSWKTDDVTALAHAPNCQPGTPLMGYMYNGQPTVNYIAVDGHIHQMWWNGSKELTDDWTALSGAAPPLFPSPLTGYAFGGQNTVFYASTDQNYLAEIWWNGSQTLHTYFGIQGSSSANGLANANF